MMIPTFVHQPVLYLCGPINGKTDAECKGWRDWTKTHWQGSCLDPMRRDYRDVPLTPGLAEEIVNHDLQDINLSDALLVYFDGPSVGTSMEIFYAAHVRAKPVFLINPGMQKSLSPWLVHHTQEVFGSLDLPTLRIIYSKLS
jgi:hypothetical protein